MHGSLSKTGYNAIQRITWSTVTKACTTALDRIDSPNELNKKTPMNLILPVHATNAPCGPRHFWSENASPRLPVIDRHASTDGTTKLLLELADGHAIESVAMAMPTTHTLCLSTQVGCPLGCVFCDTGRSGYIRNLTTSEIIAQARSTAQAVHAATQTWPERIVFMGMGEPLLNLDNLLPALRLLTSPHGPNLSWRKIIVSTVGIPDGLRALASERLALPAISLHAPTQELRDRLMPGTRRWPLTTLIPLLESYPLPGRERILIEYILIPGVNDTGNHATRVHALLGRLRTKINLIPCNPSPGTSFQKPPQLAIDTFARRLRDLGQTVFVRRDLGTDVHAACGQLRLARKLVPDHLDACAEAPS
ncbi:MAG: radical SAM protein [Deltaproteobacteria bacterium]|nr:radical SAM protein [Deltaproteobacteria bacterium]